MTEVGLADGESEGEIILGEIVGERVSAELVGYHGRMLHMCLLDSTSTNNM